MKRFGEWLLANWRPVSAIVFYIALYALAKFAPMAQAERELVLVIGNILGLFNVLVPSFAKMPKDVDVDPPHTGDK